MCHWTRRFASSRLATHAFTFSLTIAGSTARRAAVDTALRQRLGIEQRLQLLARKAGRLERDIEDRAPFLVGLLRRRRALFITDHGIECSDEDRISFERFLDPVFTHLEARDRLVGEKTHRACEDLDRLEQIRAD